VRSWGMLIIAERDCFSEEVADPVKRQFVVTRRLRRRVHAITYVLGRDNRDLMSYRLVCIKRMG